jgi:hypothetical protein
MPPCRRRAGIPRTFPDHAVMPRRILRRIGGVGSAGQETSRVGAWLPRSVHGAAPSSKPRRLGRLEDIGPDARSAEPVLVRASALHDGGHRAVFLLLHGDDWFLAPFDVYAGSLCWIDELSVTDLFGVVTTIPRADTTPGPRWTMFSTIHRTNRGLAPFLIVPSSAAVSSLEGEAVEEVHLLRDETADMAWAIEHRTSREFTGSTCSEELPWAAAS